MKGPIAVLFFILVYTNASVYGGETILRDDFTDPVFSGNLWYTHNNGGLVGFTDGFAFINLTEAKDGASTCIVDFWNRRTRPFKHMGFEIRLRCSDDNKMESEVGGGWRFWGFMDWDSDYGLGFGCASPEAGEGKSGLRAHSVIAGQTKFWGPIPGIDITNWHTYTVIWEPGNVTFLVDGKVVGATDKVPEVNLNLYLGNTNLVITAPYHVGGGAHMAVPFDTYMQIDYIRIFVNEEKFGEMDLEISELLTQSSNLISELRSKGTDTAHLMVEYEKAQADWRVDHYFYEDARSRLVKITSAIENWDEVMVLFSKADEAIATLEKEGRTRDATIAKTDYSRAEKYWIECDYEMTCSNLQKIVVRVQETCIPTVSWLMLIFTLLRLKPKYYR